MRYAEWPFRTETPSPWNKNGEDGYTVGPFTTERESVDFLERRLSACGAFITQREVVGVVQNLRPYTEGNGRVRIDLVLAPTPALLAQGWDHGFIGIECKKSSEKVGRPISQMIDYSRAAFRWRNRTIMLDYVLLWPWVSCGGPLESICVQQRLGAVTYNEYRDSVHLITGHNELACITKRGEVEFAGESKTGKKVGSR